MDNYFLLMNNDIMSKILGLLDNRSEFETVLEMYSPETLHLIKGYTKNMTRPREYCIKCDRLSVCCIVCKMCCLCLGYPKLKLGKFCDIECYKTGTIEI